MAKVITQEIRQKIFALYHGQRIQGLQQYDEKHIVNANVTSSRYFLFVKRLSSITNEDAIKINDFQCWKDYAPPLKREDRNGIRDQISVLIKNNWVNFDTIDYLRLNGFAAPAYGFSVEELVEAGVFILC